MHKQRLDQAVAQSKLTLTRSQAENYIKLGKVKVNGRVINKPGYFVSALDDIKLVQSEQYVSRAGLKLASVANTLKLDFKNKTVLDVGSSTGGFTEYALNRSAKKVIAVDVGTKQLHQKLLGNPKIELHEQTDIRGFVPIITPDMVLIDVSFISLREVLPHVAKIIDSNSLVIAMLKPQFEAGDKSKHKGVIKNNKLRRDIIKDFELWVKQYFVIKAKSDSDITGAQGNQERFYLLKANG